MTVVALFGVISVVGALRTPGNADFKAKWADWLRAHHAGLVVSPIERWYYTSQAPAPGGRPRALNVVPPPYTDPIAPLLLRPSLLPATGAAGGQPPTPRRGQVAAHRPSCRRAPRDVRGQFRADTTYTAKITTAVWIDPTLLRVRLVPGTRQPGGTWSEPPYIGAAAAVRAVAAFNGGFRVQDAHGGFYLRGRTTVPLRRGAASVLIDHDGRVNVGAWGTEVTKTPQVVAVLQNLVPMVDGGRVAPDATYHDATVWGDTLGGATVVARSGIGVTSQGAVVYVAGPALTAKTLAESESLQRSGAVRAMTLDINPEWVTFNLYRHPQPADPAQSTRPSCIPRCSARPLVTSARPENPGTSSPYPPADRPQPLETRFLRKLFARPNPHHMARRR